MMKLALWERTMLCHTVKIIRIKIEALRRRTNFGSWGYFPAIVGVGISKREC